MEWKYKYELVMVAPGGKQHPQLVHTHTHSAYIFYIVQLTAQAAHPVI